MKKKIDRNSHGEILPRDLNLPGTQINQNVAYPSGNQTQATGVEGMLCNHQTNSDIFRQHWPADRRYTKTYFGPSVISRRGVPLSSQQPEKWTIKWSSRNPYAGLEVKYLRKTEVLPNIGAA